MNQKILSQFIRGVLHSSLLNEDDVLKKLKSDVVTQDYMNSGKIHDRDIMEFLKLIKKNLNLDIVKFLGQGAFGYAFLTSDNKTVKLTRDSSEAVEGNKIRNSNSKHFPRIHNILKVKVGNDEDRPIDVYIIVKDHILQNQSFVHFMMGMNSKLEEIYRFFLRKYENRKELYFPPSFF